MAIADAYDAMVRDRPYKTAVSHEQALSELRRCAGTQFDPELISVFLRHYESVAPIPDAGLLTVQQPVPAVRPRTRTRKVIPA